MVFLKTCKRTVFSNRKLKRSTIKTFVWLQRKNRMKLIKKSNHSRFRTFYCLSFFFSSSPYISSTKQSVNIQTSVWFPVKPKKTITKEPSRLLIFSQLYFLLSFPRFSHQPNISRIQK
jgi:hypothetical protein